MTSTPPGIKAAIRQFDGSDNRFRLFPMCGSVLFTEGVYLLSCDAKCDWLLNVISSHLNEAPDLERHRLLHCSVEFDKSDGAPPTSCTVVGRPDLDAPPVFSQHIPYTDLDPAFDGLQLWAGWDGKHWHVYLPSEH